MKNIFKGFVKIIFVLFYRVSVINPANVPLKGAAVLCANHVGGLDMFFIGFRIQRMIRYMAKEELFKNPLLGAFISWLGAFPVKRGKADVGAIKTAFRLLDEGHIVGIFAEGTRRGANHEKKAKIHPGAAMFAVKKHVPVIPVAIEGSYKLFGRVRVVFGEPYYIDGDSNAKYTNEELTAMSEGIMAKVYGLLKDSRTQ